MFLCSDWSGLVVVVFRSARVAQLPEFPLAFLMKCVVATNLAENGGHGERWILACESRRRRQGSDEARLVCARRRRAPAASRHAFWGAACGCSLAQDAAVPRCRVRTCVIRHDSQGTSITVEDTELATATSCLLEARRRWGGEERRGLLHAATQSYDRQRSDADSTRPKRESTRVGSVHHWRRRTPHKHTRATAPTPSYEGRYRDSNHKGRRDDLSDVTRVGP